MTIAGDQFVQLPGPEDAPALPGSDEIFIMLDADCRVLRISAATQRLLGITNAAALIGRSGYAAVHPANLAKAAAALAACLDAPGVTHPTVIRARPLEGPWRSLDLALQNRLDDARVGAIVVTGRDATEQRRDVLLGSF